MIHILQIGLCSNPGGIENCILNYHRFINKSKVQFDYVDIYGDGLAYSDEIIELGGKIYTLPNYKQKPISAAKGIKEILIKNNYDIIHINMLSAANLIPVLMSYKTSALVIAHSHNSAVPSGIIRKLMNGINLNILRNLQIEKWACSIKAGKWMWGETFSPENVIPNAIDTERFSANLEIRKEIRQSCGFQPNDIVVGFVGRFSEQKNVLFLPEILAGLKEKSGNYKLLLVGEGVLKENLKRKIKELNLEKAVYFSGLQTDTSKWYQAMDIFVLPSLFEGLPVVAIEAQAAGLPCFISEYITKEVNISGTVKFLPIDKEAGKWVDSICEEEMNQRNRSDLVSDKYNIKCAARKLEERYTRLLTERKK